MEDFLQFLKAGYSIVVLDCGKCAIGKFSDQNGDGYFDKNLGIIDGYLSDLKVVDSVESLIELMGDRAQVKSSETPCTQD
ncbi:MAG: hypothetical protein ACRC2V_17180 [Xenococcaceae cyanobacterium]